MCRKLQKYKLRSRVLLVHRIQFTKNQTGFATNKLVKVYFQDFYIPNLDQKERAPNQAHFHCTRTQNIFLNKVNFTPFVTGDRYTWIYACQLTLHFSLYFQQTPFQLKTLSMKQQSQTMHIKIKMCISSNKFQVIKMLQLHYHVIFTVF